MSFRIINVDGKARHGEFITTHGVVKTPAFMPVGTAGFVRSTTPRDIKETGTEVLLANTYHLSLGERLFLVKYMGGLHKFMGWDQTILTDSGGFQVFSLPGRQISNDGVVFMYEENGEKITLTPEKSMEIQRDLGADIVMAFDECVEYPAPYEYVKSAANRTSLWAERCLQVPLNDHQFLFGIIQGGTFQDLRYKSAASITKLGFDGYAIGGVSVGEGHELMCQAIRHTEYLLPEDKPRYLMGVGLPEDILASVELGIDMFDCVIPTRYGRSGTFFTRTGKIRVQDKTYRKDRYPVDTKCTCYTCRNYSRMVLRYLFFTGDPLAGTLATIHNVTYYQDLMADIRTAIDQGRFASFREECLAGYNKKKLRHEKKMGLK
ncbi:MAG: tRNA guanosine(34) transglycosylase Tgt [Proteobacteria bacterium]|nr:tRNA guanosine(34) transglycosylase Tgt [Pseudomonadota bacterium]